MEQTEDGYLKALAERPDDRELRLVFCDWLLERGDPRGEAMALFEKGAPSPADRRRLKRLQELHGGRWLGPLGEVAVVKDCRFAGGLLEAVRFPANLPADRYAELTGDPRLALVQSLSIEPGRVAAELGGFLAHPVLARVVELEGDVATLVNAGALSFAPKVVRVALWQPAEDLAALAASPALRGATRLRLATVDFIVPEFAEELCEALLGSGALRGRERLELIARDATIEGVVEWLRLGPQRVRGAARDRLQRWGVEYAETQLGLQGEQFEQLTIDAMAPGGNYEVGTRLASAAAVLAQLDGIGIRRVEVRQVPGGRLEKDELNTLRAALRRLSTVEEFRVGGVLHSP